MRQKSAKDLAFDRERAKIRKEVKDLERSLKASQDQVNELNRVIAEKDELIRQQEEWINRLLEYTEMSKDELRQFIDNEKEKSELRECVIGTLGIIGVTGRKSTLSDYLRSS